jgi:hypothetical protein
MVSEHYAWAWVASEAHSQWERLGLAAGLRRYDDLRTSEHDVGQVVLQEDGPTVEHG